MRYLALAGLFALGCAHAPKPAKTAPQPDFLRANLDTTVSPGDDFFQYANGGWLKRHPIPASESGWGLGNVVNDELRASLLKINQDAAAKVNASGSDQQKIGDFWSTAMDTAKAEQLGVHLLDSAMARIAAVRSGADAIDVAFAFEPLGVQPFFGVYVGQDQKASDVMAVHIYQAGLGLPERDFYFNTDTGVTRIRAEYVAHLGRNLVLLGRDEAGARASAANVMAFETALAIASRKLEDLRDPNLNYNKLTPAEVTSKLTPSIDWTARLAAWNLRPSYVLVGQPQFLAAVDTLVKRTPVPVLQDYLRLQLLASYAPFLSRSFDEENFRFARELTGQAEERPRWKRALDSEGNAMGMVLGRIFVKEYFPEAAKKRYAAMVEAIRASYLNRINQLDWMSDSTKAKARQKLAAITPKVGYPDKWKDYSTLLIGRESYATNMMNAARWDWNDMLSKFGKPVDRTEWGMTPQTYNAYYNPSNNEIVLPAAIFAIPGVRDDHVDDAVAYGYAAASTIGHEITHGFDDQGRQFDAAGNLKDWWTASDAAKFQERAEVMRKQFDAYEPMPGMHINGKAGLGENIADYGGILLGLDAFKKTQQYREGKSMGGLTPVQRYFLGYAVGWIYQQRDAALRSALLADVHSPAKWRVLGPMSNIPEFYEAFNVQPGQPMWRAPEARVHIW